MEIQTKMRYYLTLIKKKKSHTKYKSWQIMERPEPSYIVGGN